MTHKIWVLFVPLAVGAAQTVGCSPEFRTCDVTYTCAPAGASGMGGAVGGAAGTAGRGGAKSSGEASGGTELSGESGAAPDGEAGSEADGGSGGTPDNAGSGGSGEWPGGNAGNDGTSGSGATAGTVGTAGKGGSGGGTALLADGAVCSANNECTSNSCGGRCCPVNKPCSCPQPSAKNLLNNPGFDSNVSGWSVTTSSGTGSFHWVVLSTNDQDASGCPYSGFGRIYTTGVTAVSQCVAVAASKSYNVSTSVSNGSQGDFSDEGFGNIECNLDWFTGANCTGSSVELPDGPLSASWLNVYWWKGVWKGGPWFPPSGAVSARLSCSHTCPNGMCYANVDKMGIVEAPETY